MPISIHPKCPREFKLAMTADELNAAQVNAHGLRTADCLSCIDLIATILAAGTLAHHGKFHPPTIVAEAWGLWAELQKGEVTRYDFGR